MESAIGSKTAESCCVTFGVSNIDALPLELRSIPAWCIAGPDKAPYWANGQGLFRADVTNPRHLHDFDTAVAVARQHDTGVGFILRSEDPFSVIDLDVKEDTPQETLDRFWKIAQHFDSYTELSRSGKGLHIWVRGKIGSGCRRDGVEVYSQERFMICTGRAIIDKPIAGKQELLDLMVQDIRSASAPAIALQEVEEELTDKEVYDRLAGQMNGDKFMALCCCTSTRGENLGTFTELGYPSQSEADLSLLSMLAFVSKSNEQCRRMFRMTGLGQRDKAIRNDTYLNRTLASIRGRQHRESQIEDVEAKRGADMAARMLAKKFGDAAQLPPQLESPKLEDEELLPIAEPVPLADSLPWPPGVLGALAYYIYSTAPRPVAEVAIISAIGLAAGICGKSFIIPQSGINGYFILVAQSAVGKETMFSGISTVIKQLANSSPSVLKYVDFADFASGPALVKAVAATASFVNVAGEWGHKLKRMADETGRDTSMANLRQVLTNLYQKSGPASIVGGLTYSDKDKNIASVNGVAFSMIGETTPAMFYQSLTEGMMEDGFLSRFTIIEYNGERPPLNHNYAALDPALQQHLLRMVQQAEHLNEQRTPCQVQVSQEAWAILTAFDKECDENINATKDESKRQMWNRAHLKSYRIAALLAAADNCICPVIHLPHMEWAIMLVRRNIDTLKRNMEAGNVGNGDHARIRKMLTCIEEYMRHIPSKGYNIPIALHRAGIVPRSYLQTKLNQAWVYTTHRLGSTYALNETIKALIDCGNIAEIDKLKAMEHGGTGKCYRVLSIPGK